MNATQDSVRSCTGGGEATYWTETNRTEAEARFQRAKQALLDIQQQHCAAAHELLLARAQVRQILESAFPGTEMIARREADLLQQHRHLESDIRDGGKTESLGQTLVSAGKGSGADAK